MVVSRTLHIFEPHDGRLQCFFSLEQASVVLTAAKNIQSGPFVTLPRSPSILRHKDDGYVRTRDSCGEFNLRKNDHCITLTQAISLMESYSVSIIAGEIGSRENVRLERVHRS